MVHKLLRPENPAALWIHATEAVSKRHLQSPHLFEVLEARPKAYFLVIKTYAGDFFNMS